MEIFKDVKGYEGLYQISNYGNVKGLERFDSIGRIVKQRILKTYINRSGYLILSLSKDSISKTMKIHQLVAIAFLNHIPCGHELVVDHIDNDPTNNNIENLQIVTNRQNCSKDRKGKSIYTGVHWNKKYWVASITINKKRFHLGSFDCEIKASKVYKKALSDYNNGVFDIKKIIDLNLTSKYKGVSWHKENEKWVAGISIKGKKIHLGSFSTELEASEAYQNKLKQL